jgi:glycosyltransferase involved in cell wall biosynthesis
MPVDSRSSVPHGFQGLHIGIDASRVFKQPRTGTERYAWEIVHRLLAHPAAKADRWTLFVDRQLDAAEIQTFLGHAQDHASHIEFCLLPWRRMWTHRLLGPAVQRAGLDVLFVPSHVIPFAFPPLTWLPLAVSRRRLPPTVVTIHDLGFQRWPQTHPLAQRLYLSLSTRWNVQAARHIISVSNATRQDIIATYGVSPARLTTIYEATCAPQSIPVTERAAEIAAVRAAYALPPDYAIFTGTLHPRKNIARIIEAYARLRRQQGELAGDLVLAGADGWQGDRFRVQAAQLGVAEHVRFLGYTPQAHLDALMAGARFFCFPSLFEGFGLPVLEAQSLGVPVMTSNYSSLPEVAGDAALYVDPTDIDAIADAMLRLSQDEALRQRLIAAGYENVKRFSWETAADETYRVLRQAAGQEED